MGQEHFSMAQGIIVNTYIRILDAMMMMVGRGGGGGVDDDNADALVCHLPFIRTARAIS